MALSAPLVFPDEIANWWLSHISKTLKNPDIASCLESLAPHVQQLSDRFIAEEGARELGDYGQDQAMLLAYGAFFFPQTFARVQIPLAELCELRGWHPEGSQLRVLDWGAGLGSASLGALHWLRSEAAGLEIDAYSVDAVELAAESLGLYRQLATSLGWDDCEWRFRRGDMRQPTKVFAHDAGPWDLIIASFSFNEAFEAAEEGEAEALAWLRWQLANLAPGGLLLILEPASKIASERLMSARDALVLAEEAHVWAPCLHQAACPMLGGKAWCHEVRSWPIPDHMKWLNRRMFRAIEHLKFGFVALGREAPSPLSTAGLPMRLVGPLSQMKGRWLTSGCVANGELWRLEIQKRQLHAATKALYKRTKRGDLMQVLAPEEEAAALAPHPHSGLIRLPKSAQLVPLNVKEPE